MLFHEERLSRPGRRRVLDHNRYGQRLERIMNALLRFVTVSRGFWKEFAERSQRDSIPGPSLSSQSIQNSRCALPCPSLLSIWEHLLY